MTRILRSGPLLLISGIVLALLGVVLAIGGVRLLMLGGSLYYLVAGVGVAASGVLLIAARREALWLYALVLFGTTAWALAEVRFDGWQLLPRLDVWFVLGLWLWLPFVNRHLRVVQEGRDAKLSGGRWALGGAVVIAAIVGIVAVLQNPHDYPGEVAATNMTASGAAAAPFTEPGDWTAYGHSGYGDRYAPARQITAQNVRRLQLAWTFHAADSKSPNDPDAIASEVTPLKANGLLYICTPDSLVIALDPDTGVERWRYDPKINRPANDGRRMACRGVTYHDSGAYFAAGAAAWLPAASASSALPSAPRPVPKGALAESMIRFDECPRRIFAPLANGSIVAINADTGQPCVSFGDHGVIGLHDNPSTPTHGVLNPSTPPLATRHVLIASVVDSDSANKTASTINGYDIDTGTLSWSWDTSKSTAGAPPTSGQTDMGNAPSSRGVSSVDEKLGLVYIPMGRRPTSAQQNSPGEGFGSAIVALDIATGDVRWVYQSVHHDRWGMGIDGQPSLVDLDTSNGKLPALLAATRRGDIHVIDRRDGKPIVPAPERPVPEASAAGMTVSPTQPFSALSFKPPTLRERDMWGTNPFDQLICRITFKRLRYEGIFTPPSEQGSIVYPGNPGVFGRGGIAIDPIRELAILNPDDMASVSTLHLRDTVDHGLQPLLSPLDLPCMAPPWGYIAAVDLRTMQTVWMHRNGNVREPVPFGMPLGVPSLGGPMTTGGGVVFLGGTPDHDLRAYDVGTGKTLWQAHLPAGSQATPMSYVSDKTGRQYIVVMVGGHGEAGMKTGDALVAYALPAEAGMQTTAP